MAKRVLHDRYFKQAKQDGYLARSAYKLLEIQEKFGLLRAGDRVLDVGCAPGSWLQVVSEIVGPNGLAVGVDLKPVRHPMPSNVRTLVADATDLDLELVLPEGGGGFDCVLSDMAPNTSGHGDDLISARLCREVLGIAIRVLRPGGTLAMKILEGGETAEVLSETKALFRRSKGTKPKATRDVSREMFIVAAGFRRPVVRDEAGGGRG